MKLDESKNKNPFGYAISGIIQAIKSERNLKFDFIVAIIVVILGIVCKISILEWIVCTIVIGIVISAELLNTAIETVVDLCTRQKHPLAKKAKDVAAGGVLVVAISSAIVGGLIFIPKILNLINF